jgi:CHAT domain-containing protein/tetratricopeptide (TPR) repeat protein
VALLGTAVLPAATDPSVDERCREIIALRKAAKYEEAITLARQALAEAERDFGRDSAEVAQVLNELIAALGGASESGDEAIQLAQRSLAIRRSGHDPKALGDSLISLGTAQWMTGDYDSARRALAESIDVYTRALGADDLSRAKALENLGILEWTTGDYGKARGYIEETLRIRQARLEPNDDLIGRALNNLAIVHYKMGNYPLSRQMYERSLAIRESTHGRGHPDTADVIANLGLVMEQQGEAPEARAMYEEALAIFERSLGPDHHQVASALVHIGGTLLRSGELDRSLETLQRALAIYEKAYGERHWRVDMTLESIANVLLEQGRYDEARLAAERALGLREQFAPDDARVAEPLATLAEIHERQEDLDGALPLKIRALEKTEGPLGREHPFVAYRLTELAFLQIKLGHLDTAEENLTRALAIQEKQLGPEHPDVARVLSLLSSLHWQQGRLGAARVEARRAGEIQDAALRSTLRDLPEQHALYLASRSVDPEVVLFSGLLQAGDQAADWLTSCWDWTLRRRGLVFDELARRQRAALSSDSPERLAAWERLSIARRQLAALWIRGPGDSDPKVYRSLLAGATEAKKSAEADLAQMTLTRQSDAPAGRAEVQRAVPKGGVLVEVVRVEVSPPKSRERQRQDVALVLFPDGRMDFVSLGAAARNDMLVDAWRRALEADMDRIAAGVVSAKALEASWSAGVALREAVWDPIAAKLGKASRVFLVPDGALHRVDPRALPIEGGRYLAESKRDIQLLSTGRDLVRFAAKAADRRTSPGGMLALGAPDFSAAPGARLLAAGRFRHASAECLRVAERPWTPLPQSGLEVREIAALAPKGMPVQVVTGEAASEELFRREAPKHGALHLATHGYFASEECVASLAVRTVEEAGRDTLETSVLGGNPLLLSGLVLAGAGRSDNKQTDDGVLTAEEIAGLDLTSVRMAVLSACDTGQGKIGMTEGVFGLRRALEIAGVRAVLMSLWKVPDRETRLWMKDFYEALFGGSSISGAARVASLSRLADLRRRGLPEHPYFWAGFVTAGNWN